MKNISTFKEFSFLYENNNNDLETSVTFLSSVDDYEHEGDTDNEVRKWKSLGAKTKVIKPDIPEDDPSPLIEVTIKISSSLAKKMLSKAEESLKRAAKTGDYSSAIYSWDVETIFEESDRQNKTSFVELFHKELKELESME